MRYVVRAALWIVGVAVGLAFLKQMLAHYGTGGGRFSSQWARPGSLPSALGPDQRHPPDDSLSVEVRPHASSFDSVYVVDLAVTNRSATSRSGVVINCDAVSDNGATIGRASATLPATFAPHATENVANVELRFVHRPSSTRCAVADFTVGP